MYFVYMYCVYFIVCCQWRNKRWWWWWWYKNKPISSSSFSDEDCCLLTVCGIAAFRNFLKKLVAVGNSKCVAAVEQCVISTRLRQHTAMCLMHAHLNKLVSIWHFIMPNTVFDYREHSAMWQVHNSIWLYQPLFLYHHLHGSRIHVR